MNHWIGRWLMAAASVHIVSVVYQYSAVLRDVVGRGVIDTVAGDPVTGAVVWSLLFGAVAFIGGLAVSALERTSAPLPKSLGASLLGLAIVGAALVPVSGFWLIFPPALAVLLRRP